MVASGAMLIPALAAASALVLRGASGLTLREASGLGSPARQAVADWTSRPSAASQGVSLLNFDSAVLTHSNLGGLGPDDGEHSMIISPVGSYGGSDLAVKFQVTEGWNYTAKPEENGVLDGIASINVQSGEVTSLTVTVMDSATERPIVLPSFFISVLDIDAGSVKGDGGSPHKIAGIEATELSNISGYYMMSDAQIKLREKDGAVSFIANQTGTSADNPTSPYGLSADQRIKAVMVEYKATPRFEMGLGVQDQPGGINGRNFLIAGTSDLINAPFGPCADAQVLELGTSTVDLNNLAGGTPGRRQMIKYKNAGVANKTSFDLWVEYVSGEYTPPSPVKNGLKGKLGQVNMGINNTATFNFQLVDSDTGSPFDVTNFFISFFDIDQEASGSEALTVASGMGTYFLSQNTSLQTVTSADGSVTFHSSSFGDEENNPRQASHADEAEAVTLYFSQPVSSFTVTYETISVAGRNFQFGGMTDAACPP